jgi:hypothetical protein
VPRRPEIAASIKSPCAKHELRILHQSSSQAISYDEQAALILADAQVHATLANAAAVALGHGRNEEVRWRDIGGSTLRGPG